MGFLMRVQVPFICHSLIASSKLTGPCFDVSLCMCRQVTLSNKLFGTVLTLISGLSYMYFHMLRYFTTKVERLIEKFTSILFGKMSIGMPYQGVGCCKIFITDIAHYWVVIPLVELFKCCNESKTLTQYPQ